MVKNKLPKTANTGPIRKSGPQKVKGNKTKKGKVSGNKMKKRMKK